MQKHILMVLDEEFPPDDRVYKEAKSLIGAGFSVSIACYTFTDRAEFELIDGIKVFRKRVPTFIYKSSVAALKFPVYFNWWKKYLNSLFEQHQFDAIHIHDLPLTKVGVYFKQKYNIKLVVDLHENWPAVLETAKHTNTFLGKILSSNKQWRKYEKNILQKADLIVALVEEMRDRLIDLSLNPDKITILHNAIDIQRFKNFGESVDNQFFTLFYAGDITHFRGLHTMIEDLIIAKTKIKNLRVWIVGKGNFLSELQSLVEKHHLNDIFVFWNWQPLEKVMSLMEQVDVGLMPHLRWEQTDCSSPNKLFQYMLKGKPYLANYSVSINRIVNETKSGLVYDANLKNDFLEKLMLLYNSPEKRTEMGKSGTKAVLEKYNWDSMVNNLIDEYRQLLS